MEIFHAERGGFNNKKITPGKIPKNLFFKRQHFSFRVRRGVVVAGTIYLPLSHGCTCDLDRLTEDQLIFRQSIVDCFGTYTEIFHAVQSSYTLEA